MELVYIVGGIMGGVITAFLAVMTFFLARIDKARKEASDSTAMKKDIEHLVATTNGMSSRLDDHNKRTDESIRRLHEKLDDHVNLYHSSVGKG